MQLPKMTVKLFGPTLAAILMFAACSKQEPQPERKPEPPKPVANKTVEVPKPVAAPPATVSATKPPPPTAPPAQPVVPSSVDVAQQAAQLESSYVSNPDFSARVQLIYKLSDLDSVAAVSSLGRIFQMEKDPDLRIEVLDSLYDIEGSDDKKAAILAAGAAADQPKEVRESAIDGLSDLDPKKALPILQALVSDRDEDIREAAKDAIEQLQSDMNNP